MHEKPPLTENILPRPNWVRRHRQHITVGVILLLLAAVFILAHGKRKNRSITTTNEKNEVVEVQGDSEAIKAGKQLTNNQCEGAGVPYKLSVPPMKADDFAMIIPYGLVVGDHVTPIDHQYFSPTVFHSPRDTYDVVAMADSTIVDIGARPRKDRNGQDFEEYRFVFTITCTYLYYYDLVTSLAPDIKAAYDSRNQGGRRDPLNIKVKAGQKIGKIGGQTLDFAVWDTTKPLTGFIVTEHYNDESWKLYTADPLDYYTDDLKALALSKYLRTVEPISGKIDYDIDGKLIGNWFLDGTDYGGQIGAQPGPGSYKGHLSFAPEHLDPNWFVISMGDYGGEAKQFVTPTNSPKPESVSVETGLVKYDLAEINYTKADGSDWDRTSFTKGPRAKPNRFIRGCALVQLTEARKLKFEAFPNEKCSSVGDFSAAVKTYTR